MQKLKEIVYVPISKVVRDEHQPRQYFDEIKLGLLSGSIKKMGIKEPLTVEALPDGTYKIVDGERRWRAARAIGLKELPVIIETALSADERVIEQFHIQEMREGWRADEKAIAINSLAQVLGVKFTDAAKMVGVTGKTADAYQSLMALTDRETFLSHRLSVKMASHVRGILQTARFQTAKQLEKEMSEKELNALEKHLVQKLISGEFTMGEHFRVLRDSIVKDANNIARFVKGANPAELFNASDAGGVRAYRNVSSGMVNLTTHIRRLSHSKEGVLLAESDAVFKTRLKSVMKELKALSEAIN